MKKKCKIGTLLKGVGPLLAEAKRKKGNSTCLTKTESLGLFQSKVGSIA